MKRTTLYTELAFVAGLILLAVGTALMKYGGFGISMVAAPAYVIYLKVSQAVPAFGFGAAGYLTEAVILLCMMLIIRRAKLTYLFSFVTAVCYGLALDAISLLTDLLPQHTPWLQVPGYIFGVLLCSLAISLLFRAYFPPAAHEMFVKEVAAHKRIKLPVLKTIYDCSLLLIAILLSLLLFGDIRSIGIGTILCAFLNGALIRLFTALTDKLFTFRDAFPLRSRFEESEDAL